MGLPLFFLCLVLLHSLTGGSAKAQRPLPPDYHNRWPYYRICPFPRCDTCPDDATLRAPGIGLALESGHGTAAIKFHNGTFHDVVLLEGDDSYNDLMHRLAAGPIKRTPDHIDSRWEKFQYVKARAQRLANKLIGRPATPETAILASMVSKLVRATSAWLGDEHTVAAVVLSSPDRIQLTEEELGDIFDYLKLQSLTINPWTLYQPYAASFVYASYGKGLCSNYTDAYACDEEEWYLPRHRVLHVDLSSDALSSTVKTIQSVYGASGITGFVDAQLGYKLENTRNTLGDRANDEEVYWAAVSARMRELVEPFNRVFLPYVTELLLSGPFAPNKQFQDSVRSAIQDLVGEGDVLEIMDDHESGLKDEREWQSFFTFATARGAAEIAKRRQEGPVQCAQSDECRRRRERLHNEGRSVFFDQSYGDAMAPPSRTF